MKKTLVFGASLKPERYSNRVIKRLIASRIETEAFGLKEGIVSGVQIKSNLNDFQNIHTITLYLSPDKQEKYYKDLINLAPHRVIFNPGTENPNFYALLEKENITAEIACTLTLLLLDQY
jgi:predicted CoA-binding protein